jgi:hypothetical protein
VQAVPDIDAWAHEVALREAAAVRDAVREALLAGRGTRAALGEVRLRLATLTPAQREIAIDAIGAAATPASP